MRESTYRSNHILDHLPLLTFWTVYRSRKQKFILTHTLCQTGIPELLDTPSVETLHSQNNCFSLYFHKDMSRLSLCQLRIYQNSTIQVGLHQCAQLCFAEIIWMCLEIRQGLYTIFIRISPTCRQETSLLLILKTIPKNSPIENPNNAQL